jgi:FkbM family methyltransferase
VSTLAKAIARLAELGASIPVEPVFVDVGANIGTTTVRALRRHGFASGVALEPSPDNFRLLRLNLTANGLESVVQALPVAAGDRPGTVTLDVANANHGAHRVAAQVSTDGVTVESVTLDGLVESGIVDPSQAGLLWIDAPGSESGALLGATRLLEAGVPVVVSIRPGGFPERLADLLTACYTDAVELRKQERILPIDAVPGLSGSYRHKGDVLLVRRS